MLNAFGVGVVAGAILFAAGCDDSSEGPKEVDETASAATEEKAPEKYPEFIRNQIVSECSADDVPAAFCDCMVTELEKKLPMSELMRAGFETMGNGEPNEEFTRKAQEAGIACVEHFQDEDMGG